MFFQPVKKVDEFLYEIQQEIDKSNQYLLEIRALVRLLNEERTKFDQLPVSDWNPEMFSLSETNLNLCQELNLLKNCLPIYSSILSIHAKDFISDDINNMPTKEKKSKILEHHFISLRSANNNAARAIQETKESFILQGMILDNDAEVSVDPNNNNRPGF